MIVGFDISTRRLDWAWLAEHGRPMHCFHVLEGEDIIDRVRMVRSLGLPADMQEACIEYPYSVNRQTNASLMAVMGALTTRIYPDVRVSWVTSHDLRAAVGIENTKAAVREWAMQQSGWMPVLAAWDEHGLDALVACLGWTQILSLQE